MLPDAWAVNEPALNWMDPPNVKSPSLPVMVARTCPDPDMSLLSAVLAARTMCNWLPLARVTAPCPNVPVEPPLPICSVPLLTVVVPL